MAIEIDLSPLHALLRKHWQGGDVSTHPDYPRYRLQYEKGIAEDRSSRFVLADIGEALAHQQGESKRRLGW